METIIKKQNYLDRKRALILDMGYDFVRFKSRTKKSLATLKRQISSFQS
ncbi:hypothetical protein [Croceivirga thetidis]|nr:hypothetical protein [Croceivirga thetidis]